jgi:predicted dehydrogenase
MPTSPFRPATRRQFLAAAGATGLTLLTSRKAPAAGPVEVQRPPSERLNIACVGAGGRASDDLRILSDCGVNVVALAEVDARRGAGSFKKYPKAAIFTDYRKMLDARHKDIDALVVACPDHHHAFATMAAMQLGKHVYCEKPLTHDIYEARTIAQAAKKYGVATQMGNNGHGGEGIRLTVEWLRAGAIGPVTQVHIWTDRPGNWWPQPGNRRRPKETPPVPSTLDWDQWVGPAPDRPYNPAYLPFNWRGWWDFGTGALGDMGCHVIDAPFWALDLGAPAWVEAQSEGNTEESGPAWSIITYQFPARGPNLPACKLVWYDGGKRPPRPPELEPDRDWNKAPGGTLFVGEKGKMLGATATSGPRLIPEAKMKEFKRPEKTIPRSVGHHLEWVQACMGGKPTVDGFDYAGPLTELVLLGNVALRAGQRIEWDPTNLKLTNAPNHQHLIHREYRKGWSL